VDKPRIQILGLPNCDSAVSHDPHGSITKVVGKPITVYWRMTEPSVFGSRVKIAGTVSSLSPASIER